MPPQSSFRGSDYEHATTRFCQSNGGSIGDRGNDVGTTIGDSSGAFRPSCCAARRADGTWTCAMDAWTDGGETAVDSVDSS